VVDRVLCVVANSCVKQFCSCIDSSLNGPADGMSPYWGCLAICTASIVVQRQCSPGRGVWPQPDLEIMCTKTWDRNSWPGWRYILCSIVRGGKNEINVNIVYWWSSQFQLLKNRLRWTLDIGEWLMSDNVWLCLWLCMFFLLYPEYEINIII
jgi:hypothetical protein